MMAWQVLEFKVAWKAQSSDDYKQNILSLRDFSLVAHEINTLSFVLVCKIKEDL